MINILICSLSLQHKMQGGGDRKWGERAVMWISLCYLVCENDFDTRDNILFKVEHKNSRTFHSDGAGWFPLFLSLRVAWWIKWDEGGLIFAVIGR